MLNSSAIIIRGCFLGEFLRRRHKGGIAWSPQREIHFLRLAVAEIGWLGIAPQLPLVGGHSQAIDPKKLRFPARALGERLLTLIFGRSWFLRGSVFLLG